MSFRITYLGGTETVTGSKFLVETRTTQVLVDCGLFQGYKWLRERNWQPLPININLSKLDAVLLTHAHLDHSGYVPALYKQGYRGPVFAHPATIELCQILLPDSGHIQQEDAYFYAKHKIGKHKNPLPLYDQALAEKSLSLFQPLEFHQKLRIGDISIEFYSAGHILGASFIVLESGGKRIAFSGDIGKSDDVFMFGAEQLPALDLLMLESTYGNRLHEKNDVFTQLEEIVNSTVGRGGCLLIPSFAVGRAQLLQYMLASLIEQNRIPQLPIFLDSPMAINVSNIYQRYCNLHRLTSAECKLMNKYIRNTASVNDSKAIAELNYPHIIIAGSGMATGGRVLHHMRYLLADHRNTVLFAGYQSGGTRGAKMVQGADTVKIHGNWLPVKAQVKALEGLSGHADANNLLEWLKQSKMRAGSEIALVHGEPDALESMRELIARETNYKVEVAAYRSIKTLEGY